jgi:hypothetical protein
MKRTISVLTFLCASLSTAAAFAEQWSGTYTPAMPSRADDVDNIGNAGQFVFGVERVTGLFFDRETAKYTDDQTGIEHEQTVSTTTIGLFGMSAPPPQNRPDPKVGVLAGMQSASSLPRLALDYLPIDGLSVGGSLTYINHSADVDNNDGGNETSADLGTVSVFVVNPRVGYAFPFDETFGLWPRLGVAFLSRTSDFDFVPDPTSAGVPTTVEASQTDWQLTLDAMVVLSPFSHFAALIGPYLDLGFAGSYESNLLNDNRNTSLVSFGLTTAIVGYY